MQILSIMIGRKRFIMAKERIKLNVNGIGFEVDKEQQLVLSSVDDHILVQPITVLTHVSNIRAETAYVVGTTGELLQKRDSIWAISGDDGRVSIRPSTPVDADGVVYDHHTVLHVGDNTMIVIKRIGNSVSVSKKVSGLDHLDEYVYSSKYSD